MLDERGVQLSWLVRLRWAALAGQLAVVAVVDGVLDIPLPLLPLSVLLGLAGLSNLVALVRARRAPVGERWVVGLLALDLLLFTGLLYFTGGPGNPFSFLYLVHIALAALMVRPAVAWGLVALALACSAGLFFHHVPLPVARDEELPPCCAAAGGAEHPHAHAHGHTGALAEEHELHLRGMWVAFGVAASFIVYFLHRQLAELRARDAEIARMRADAERRERVASLATLAAGAAHELATPLTTVAVAARELERELEKLGEVGEAAREEARAIRGAVARCREVLGRLASDAGHPGGEPRREVTVRELVVAAVEGARGADRVKLDLGELAERRLEVPAQAVAQALRSLVENAADASPVDAPIDIVATAAGAPELVLAVVDRGVGMSDAVRARAGEPFFTTKPSGLGMGLGLFLARSVAEQLGGRLELLPGRPSGVEARLALPLPGG